MVNIANADNTENTENKNTKKNSIEKNSIRIASYVIGGLGVMVLVAAILMLVFLRTTSTVVTTVVPSGIFVTPSYAPLPELKLQKPLFIQTFGLSDFIGITTPVVTVTDVPLVTVTQPDVEPGMIPFDETNVYPLQSPPQGFGWVAMTPTGDQWFSSLPNGYLEVAQYTYNDTKFSADQDAYKTIANSVSLCRIDPADPENDSITGVNPAASSVGSVGYSAIKMSDDGSRLYVAYRQPLMGSSGDSQIFPFLQLSGQVATFTQLQTTDWAYACQLELSNPYGSQVAQFEQLINPNTGTLMTGDDFGSILRVTVNLNNGNRVVAARSNFGIRISDGSFVSIVEESNDGTYVQSGIVFAPIKYTLSQKFSFANDFAIGNDSLVCTMQGVGIFYFQRDDVKNQWIERELITAPSTAATQDFGCSLCVRSDGAQMIVGSPTNPSLTVTGIGGNVYVYSKQSNKWNLTQTFADPFLTDHTSGAFGRFISVDKRFLVAAITANSSNFLGFKTGSTLTNVKQTDLPSVVLCSINQTTGKIDEQNCQQIYQNLVTLVTTMYIDPLFGANATLEFQDEQNSILRLILPSPVNQVAAFFSIAANG